MCMCACVRINSLIFIYYYSLSLSRLYIVRGTTFNVWDPFYTCVPLFIFIRELFFLTAMANVCDF